MKKRITTRISQAVLIAILSCFIFTTQVYSQTACDATCPCGSPPVTETIDFVEALDQDGAANQGTSTSGILTTTGTTELIGKDQTLILMPQHSGIKMLQEILYPAPPQ